MQVGIYIIETKTIYGDSKLLQKIIFLSKTIPAITSPKYKKQGVEPRILIYLLENA